MQAAAWALCLLAASQTFAADSAATPAKPAAAEPAAADGDALVTRVYNVADLVVPKPAHRVQEVGIGGGLNTSAGYGMGGIGPGLGGLGGMGVGGGMGGGGFFNVQDGFPGSPAPPGGPAPTVPSQPSAGPPTPPPGSAAPPELTFTITDLMQAIKESVEPSTWSEVGGPGSIARLGGMLVVNQTPAVHQKIQNFLDAVRESGAGQRVVNLRARWLLLDAKQIEQLAGNTSKDGAVDRAALEALAAKVKSYRGEISCFDGQTVHVVSGRLQSKVVGAIPVVGGDTPAYQPIVASPQSGLVLQVTPQVLPNVDAVVLDVQSVFTQLQDDAKPIEFLSKKYGAEIRLDRVHAVVQRLATTTRVPLGQAILVGGLTVEPPADAAQPADQPSQLYLFLEAFVR